MTIRHRLVNTTTRPVELHLPRGVVVLPALGELPCTEDDLGTGQVKALCSNGVLVHRESRERAAETEEKPQAERARPRKARSPKPRPPKPTAARAAGGAVAKSKKRPPDKQTPS